jgi:uncharacterized protein (TIGR02271 family)
MLVKSIWRLSGVPTSEIHSEAHRVEKGIKQMKLFKKAIYWSWGLPLIAGATALVLGGCCSSSGSKAAYAAPEPAYAGGTAEQPPASTTGTYAEEGKPSGEIPLWKEDLKVGKREVEVGSVRLQKTVKERTANEPLDLNQQEIVIDRVPGGQAQDKGKAFQNSEIVIPLKREESVVEIDKVPAGTVTVHTRWSTEHTNVTAQLRQEDVTVSKQGDTKNVMFGSNFKGNTENEAMGGAESPSGQTAGGAGGSGVITDASVFATADPATLTGRPVNLSGLQVQRVVGGKLFVMQAGNGQQLYVVDKDQTLSNINPGDTLQIQGKVQQPGTGMSSMGLNSQDMQALNSQRCYISADDIQVVNQ